MVGLITRTGRLGSGIPGIHRAPINWSNGTCIDPAEALYRTESDPYELENLIGRPGTEAIMKSLSDELDRWMVGQGDPGMEQDTHRTHRAAKDGQHRFRPPARASASD